MKLFYIILSLLITVGCWGQTIEDFYSNKTQVVLLGLDFTKAKFIGKEDFGNPEGLKNHALKNWNRFFATEPNKYSLQKAFGLSDKYYYNSINYFLKRNDELVNTYTIATDESYTLTNEDIKETVSSYSTFEKEGLAVSFVVESFNKLKNEAVIWVTYISLPDNEIIATERMVGNPGGAGQVNYWARAVYDIVTQIEKNSKGKK
jgi:hypothetical protein